MTKEEAIKRIKDWNLDDDDMEVLTAAIPELKEDGDDERIRKAIVNHLLELSKSRVNLMTKATYENWITWLEKQGKQKTQSKQGWSEEDSVKLNDVVRIIENSGNVKSIIEHYVNWLKSLKERV